MHNTRMLNSRQQIHHNTQQHKPNQALLSFGQALLGKTSEEYLAEAPARIFALAKHPIEPRGPSISNAKSAVADPAPQVLGLSTTSTPAPTASTKRSRAILLPENSPARRDRKAQREQAASLPV